MKTKYFALVIDLNDNISVKDLGECYTENQAITRANLCRNEGVSILWTFDSSKLEALKLSINSLQ